jgi:hypothetical protein
MRTLAKKIGGVATTPRLRPSSLQFASKELPGKSPFQAPLPALVRIGTADERALNIEGAVSASKIELRLVPVTIVTRIDVNPMLRKGWSLASVRLRSALASLRSIESVHRGFS